MAWNETFSEDASNAVANSTFDRAQDSSRPAPEDGARLLRAFVNIRQPALREAIIELVTRMSEVNDLLI
jgi:hypothetical protein